MQYLIIIEKADNGFSAYAPDLPGCVAAADTLERTRRLMAEAVELHIEGLKEASHPIPQPASVAEYVSYQQAL